MDAEGMTYVWKHTNHPARTETIARTAAAERTAARAADLRLALEDCISTSCYQNCQPYRSRKTTAVIRP
jgi:hypothetical protein